MVLTMPLRFNPSKDGQLRASTSVGHRVGCDQLLEALASEALGMRDLMEVETWLGTLTRTKAERLTREHLATYGTAGFFGTHGELDYPAGDAIPMIEDRLSDLFPEIS